MRGDETRSRIKLAARRLFAERGIDGVSIREIVAAAGQRNVGSLHYYFRTKEALVRELVVDGARLVDGRRNQMLETMRRDGGPKTLREVIEVLVWPSVGLGEGEGEEDTYMRFIASLTMNHHDLFLNALEGKWNSGYKQCLEHIKALLPHVPESVVDERIIFIRIFLDSIMAAREAAFEGAGASSNREFWASKRIMSHLIESVAAMLDAPRAASFDAAGTSAPCHPRTINCAPRTPAPSAFDAGRIG